ncbi:hypothetical protein PG991_010623 [Apiospora marii]|uniref:Uncharacterized protein n=1 Tax=Apiospora marii TaxID=335849 RepID=A0ABR1RCY9_9PEZI
MLVVGWADQACANETSISLVPLYEPYLSRVPLSSADFNPYFGGRNTGTCCLMAVSESLHIQKGRLALRPGQTLYHGTLATLEQYPTFPCTTTFNGSLIAPPQDFWTPYPWCSDRCPGWSVTKADDMDGWMKPLLAWILPALVFSLSIPRRRRIELPGFIFTHSLHITDFLLLPPKVALASIIVTIDTLIWLGVLFAMAGPICFSLTYEAILDAKLVRYLEAQVDSTRCSVKERVHLLLTLLLGYLNPDTAAADSQGFLSSLPDHIPLPGHIPSPVRVHYPSLSSDKTITSQTIEADLRAGPSSRTSQLPVDPTTKASSTESAKRQLLAILDSQPSFGVTVGAPALFYIGSFIWGVL